MGKFIIEKIGQYYIGDFKNGLADGKGIVFWKNGDPLYEGDWLNGKIDGYGKFYFDNGNYYIGKWKNSEMEGKGCNKLQ